MKKLRSLGLAVLVFLATALPAFGADMMMEVSIGLTADGMDYNDQSLQPGREYRFPLLVRYEDEVPSHLREEEMEGKRLTASLRQGNAASSPSIDLEGGRYYLVLKTKADYGTKASQLEVQVKLQDRGSGREISRASVQLTVGSSRMPDEAVGEVQEGEVFRVDNNYPVITKKQFQKLAEANGYRSVTLAGDGWEYTVNVTDLGDRNLYSTSAISQEVLDKYPAQNFRFLSFPAGPDFGGAGTMVLDVEELPEFDGEFYLYRRLGDRLYYLKSQYDPQEQTLTFRPSQLGNYLITDRKLGDVELGDVVTGASDNGYAPNPDTGGQRAIAPAALLGLAALVTGMVVTFQRR